MDFYGSTGLLAGLSFNLAKIYFSLYAPFFQGENSTLRTKISTCNIFIEILFEISRAHRWVCSCEKRFTLFNLYGLQNVGWGHCVYPLKNVQIVKRQIFPDVSWETKSYVHIPKSKHPSKKRKFLSKSLFPVLNQKATFWFPKYEF